MNPSDPAFPDEYRDGLAVRDYLAAAAMTGLLAATGNAPDAITEDGSQVHGNETSLARTAYWLADAALRVRTEGRTEGRTA